MGALQDTVRIQALDEGAVATFKAGLRGELIRPGDEAYDGARKVWNGMIDRRPALIARCVGVADVIAAMYPNPSDTEKNVAWVRDYWSALHPYSSGGAYVNFLMEEGEDRIKATYGENYDRLAALKSKYDPTNLFRLNQNVRPRA